MTVIIILLLAAGFFFFLVGVAGLIRLPDVYCRMHATTKCDTLGAGLILFALAVYSLMTTGLSSSFMKLIIMIAFVWLTNPTAAHVIARAAYRNNAQACEGTYELDKTGEVQCGD